MSCAPRTELCDVVEEIAEYTSKNPSLSRSHHFLYNLPLKQTANGPTVIILGLNPGESKDDLKRGDKVMQQETCCHDFHGEQRHKLKWTRTCLDFCGEDVSPVQSEAFFWSSPRWNDACFLARFGFDVFDDEGRKHLKFCKQQNRKLIDYYKPKAVLVPGLEALKFVPSIYELKEAGDVVMCPQRKTHRLMQKFRDQHNIPWLITKHWSGARDFTNQQKSAIKKEIRDLISA